MEDLLPATGYRFRTPSPKRRGARGAPKEYSDRYIPSRAGTNWEVGMGGLLDEKENEARTGNKPTQPARTGETAQADKYQQLLHAELLGATSSPPPRSPEASGEPAVLRTPERRGLLGYKSSPEAAFEDVMSLSPFQSRSGEASAPRSPPRQVPKKPARILDAPGLSTDFYLNLIDISSEDTLAVGRCARVSLWHAPTKRATELCDVGPQDSVSSVSWAPNGTHLAVGSTKGDVQLWDTQECKRLATFSGHSGRVCAMAWNGQVISSAGLGGDILQHDWRQGKEPVAVLRSHPEEVCGLRWSPDGTHLASGSSDGSICIWAAGNNAAPITQIDGHQAAVKALAWSPHHRGVLATGGGTADRCIKIWNALSGTMRSSLDTGAQVCNLMWSQSVNEILSTHGYAQNEICIWKCPAISQVATLRGHGSRVLYLAAFRDGKTIVTGDENESLFVWNNVFPTAKPRLSERLSSPLLLSPPIR